MEKEFFVHGFWGFYESPIEPQTDFMSCIEDTESLKNFWSKDTLEILKEFNKQNSDNFANSNEFAMSFNNYLWKIDRHTYRDGLSYKEACTEIARECFSRFINLLPDLAAMGVSKIAFSDLVSPKFYNYESDKLYCKVKFNQSKFKAYLKKYIFTENNRSWIEDIITNLHGSRSGFMSFYSYDIEDWKNFKLEFDNITLSTYMYLIALDQFSGYLDEMVREFEEKINLDY